ncbi:EH domain-containing protein 1-like [Schistocerca serialis cubense]|uniref:EH domain-containing protein 1-like n=1 Tax=Schistocerca serialis cubense TaxID=2023355 RepID=UPI00214E3243|nr:EH domain-containing protein 1-like [Schistocerca serialis cubense]
MIALECRFRQVTGLLLRRCYASWFGTSEKATEYGNVVDGLKTVYSMKLLPLEKKYLFHEFHSPQLFDSDFAAKPLILLMGQYSTGKTTFIRYILGSDFPGMRIGPEPTTDRFVAVMHGSEEQEIPGNALVVDPNRQFRPLARFGNNFLNRFQCSLINSDVLNYVSFVDTPGILSGEKQRVNRGYDFDGVLHWFAERVDRIILLFDANKLDISDEFRRCIDILRSQDEKIRIVLNKADQVNQQQLMRVYGALMWSLGKILNFPEVARVYVGSFWDKPLLHDENRRLFEDETRDLFLDLRSLPRDAILRKINDLSRRARLAKAHACIIGELQQQMPAFFGKDKKKQELIDNLPQIYATLQSKYMISAGDFPDIEKMKVLLNSANFDRFEGITPSLLRSVDDMLVKDISKFMSMLAAEKIEEEKLGSKKFIHGGAFVSVVDTENPFSEREGIRQGLGEKEWVVEKFRSQYDDTFDNLKPQHGKLTKTDVKDELRKSKLSSHILNSIWLLADVDKDNMLDKDEFALAMYLVRLKADGHNLPETLPEHLIPPSKRLANNVESRVEIPNKI